MQNKKEDLNKMAKCICCGKTGADYLHYNGGYVCDDLHVLRVEGFLI